MCSSEPPVRREPEPGLVTGSRPGAGSREVAVVRGVRRRADRGYVTAEAALALPVLLLFGLALVWALMAAAAQIQCVDAARAGARAAARQEPQAATEAAARQAAPDGARIGFRRDGDLVRVLVEAPAPGSGRVGLGLTLRAEAVALAEETVGARSGTGAET